jgi:hypothetical protein
VLSSKVESGRWALSRQVPEGDFIEAAVDRMLGDDVHGSGSRASAGARGEGQAFDRTDLMEFLRPPLPIDYKQVRTSIRSASERCSQVIRSIEDPSVATRGLSWSLGETAAHLCTTMRLYIDCLEERVSPEPQLVADVPSFVAVQNDERLERFAERDPLALSKLLESDVSSFLALLEARSPEDAVPFPAGYQISVAIQACFALAELLIHGRDIARSIRRPWPISSDDAILVLSGVTALLPVSADPERAKRVRGTIHVRLRGDGCYAVRISQGSVSTSECSGRADLYISADPIASLLVGYGRMSRWIPVIKGKIIAWGPKPWLALRFSSLFRTG